MNPINKIFIALYLFLTLVPILPTNGISYAQEVKSSTAERDTLLSVARQYIHNVRFCALITIDSSGYPHARTMDPFQPDENMIVWFGTNRNSRKVKEIRNNPNVTLYYTGNKGEGYVSIIGTAGLVDDPKIKDSLWKDEWAKLYKDQKQNYLLIKVVPKKLEILNLRHGIAGNKETWETPFVSF